MFLGLRTVGYHVPEDRLDEAKAWYTKASGVAPYFDQPFYVGFNVGGFELGLQPSGKQGPGGTVGYWGTKDIASEVNRLFDIGATIVDPIQDVGEGILVATLADPFGNLFGVIENPLFDPRAVT
ncbi:MAG TPA: VOC family protein [Fimbriiglobus sp.]|jgi:predicted enzyme related to lactoylglutathione lyase